MKVQLYDSFLSTPPFRATRPITRLLFAIAALEGFYEKGDFKMGKMISFRVSDREYEIIDKLTIETCSMSISDYIRRMTTGARCQECTCKAQNGDISDFNSEAE